MVLGPRQHRSELKLAPERAEQERRGYEQEQGRYERRYERRSERARGGPMRWRRRVPSRDR
jgi:hypothetical protein